MAFTYANNAGTGTDQEILEYARGALARILATGQAHGFDGSNWTAADVDKVQAIIDIYQGRVDRAKTTRQPYNQARLVRPR